MDISITSDSWDYDNGCDYTRLYTSAEEDSINSWDYDNGCDYTRLYTSAEEDSINEDDCFYMDVEYNMTISLPLGENTQTIIVNHRDFETMTYDSSLDSLDMNQWFKTTIPTPSMTHDNFPIYTFTTINGDCQSCCICLNEFGFGDKVKILPCIHYFHCDCINTWLNKSKICPICRNNVDILANDSINYK
jgi:hypothetical protein